MIRCRLDAVAFARAVAICAEEQCMSSIQSSIMSSIMFVRQLGSVAESASGLGMMDFF